jgi:hypothetical protein
MEDPLEFDLEQSAPRTSAAPLFLLSLSKPFFSPCVDIAPLSCPFAQASGDDVPPGGEQSIVVDGPEGSVFVPSAALLAALTLAPA